MRITNALKSDAGIIGKLLSVSYNIKNENEGKDVFLKEIKKGHKYIVSKSETKVIGIISWLTHGLPKHGLAELDRIAVLPDFKGQGIAKKMFEFMINDINRYYERYDHKLRKFYVLTHEDNIRAQRFYEKMGFEKEVTLKEHYYNDKDEVLMSMFF